MRMVQEQLDPDAAKRADEANVASGTNSSTATIKDVLGQSQPSVPPIQKPGERRVTIWFNAWKYESTAQVWAGLADCIVRQVGERLNPIQREIFWFRLQTRRLDAARIRRKIHLQVLSAFLEKLFSWSPAYLLGLAAALVLAVFQKVWIGVSGIFLELLATSLQLWAAKTQTEKKPARVDLAEFVHAPDYDANLGFVHEVVEDLRRVFSLIPAKDLPMVIFIDDLDRCSPVKVAAVIEAINLFLAGEFPGCMFILGIDDEMVAAALDKAHSEVISKLPLYARSTSIGWRFMDKFVQLPFVIPPPTSQDVARYTDSLFSQGDPHTQADANALDRAARVVEQHHGSPISAEQVVTQAVGQEQLAPKQREALKQEVKIIQDMDKNIKRFTDQEERIRDLISRHSKEHFNNPRDVKRFVNLFRFYYFLRAARQARGEPVVSVSQLARWLVLSLKWPEVLRWIRHNASSANAPAGQHLAKMEKLASPVGTFTAWQNGMDKTFGLKPLDVSWLRNEELYEFFKREADSDEWKRLSSCDEKGLW